MPCPTWSWNASSGVRGVAVLAHHLERERLAVDEVDGRGVEADDLAQRLEDRLDDAVQLERRRDRAAQLEQHLLLERAPLGLLIEQRVVERERDVLDRDLEPVEVDGGELARSLLVETLDRAERRAAPEQRDHERRRERIDLALELGSRVVGAEPQRLLVHDRPAGESLAAAEAALDRGRVVFAKLLCDQPSPAAARDPDAGDPGRDQPATVAGHRPQQVVEVSRGVEGLGGGSPEGGDAPQRGVRSGIAFFAQRVGRRGAGHSGSQPSMGFVKSQRMGPTSSPGAIGPDRS